ncbi:MAG: hypothetical protein WCP89_00155 [archaeon]
MERNESNKRRNDRNIGWGNLGLSLLCGGIGVYTTIRAAYEHDNSLQTLGAASLAGVLALYFGYAADLGLSGRNLRRTSRNSIDPNQQQ